MAGKSSPPAPGEMLDRLEDLLPPRARQGAVEADAFMVEEELQTVQVRLGTVESLKHARENRCSLRIFTESGSASATTSDLSPGALARLVDESVRLAQVTRRDEHSGLPGGGAGPGGSGSRRCGTPRAIAMAVEEKIDWARRAEAAALETDARVRNSEGAEFYNRQGRVAYASTGGFAAGFRVSSFALSVTPVASDEATWSGTTGTRRPVSLADLESRRRRSGGRRRGGRCAGSAAARAETTRGARSSSIPETAAEPDTELWRWPRRARASTAARRSWSASTGRPSRRPGVTIVDDPLMPQGLGSRPFDGEGLPSRRTVLVDRGVLSSYLLDTYSARRLGLDGDRPRGSGGRGRRDGRVHQPLPRARAAGHPRRSSASVERGLYVTELIGFGVNFVTGDYSRGAVGFWIEGGELTYPVEEITVAGNLRKMLQDVEMVGRDLAFRDQTAAPTLKISRLTVAGQ